jgi:hypothetical protein
VPNNFAEFSLCEPMNFEEIPIFYIFFSMYKEILKYIFVNFFFFYLSSIYLSL